MFGSYQGGLLEFPRLGYAFPAKPSDLFFIRGAGILHDVTGWEGKGRMVFALFSDRRIFTHEGVPRPKDIAKTYGRRQYKKYREKHPCEQPDSLKRKRNGQEEPRKRRKGDVV
jgi:hypothetical protein